MAGRYVFAPLAGGPPDEALLKHAETLGRRIGAAVEAAFVEPDDAAYLAGLSVIDGLPGAALTAMSEAREEGLRRAREAFNAVFDGAAESAARFCGALGRAELAVATRLAVYAVVDSESASGEGPFSSLFEDFLFGDAAPVVIPRGAFDLSRIGIAWNGSREAATAMKHALPLLQASDPVEAQMWLQAREIDARQVRTGDGGAGSAIVAACAEHDCGLLVAGAYGHSRARQLVFGGATRAFVQRADGPSLLLAH